VEQTLLEITSEHVKDKKVTVSNQHGLMKGASYLTNMIAFYHEISGVMGEGRAVDVVCS